MFRTRIELRQIGVRDEARQLGSLGICGRFLCCSTFLNDFQPVSIKMAKEQGLSLNPTKISGACGRLMCCLQYEQDAYEDMLAKMPKRGDKVETPDGVGIVAETATLKGQIKVKFPDESGENGRLETYVLGDFQALDKNGKVRLERPKDKEEEELAYEMMTSEEASGESEQKPAVNPEQESKQDKGNRHRRHHRRRPKKSGNGEKKNNDEKPAPQQGGYSNGY
jgi:cell fate regulator YaaT (PSP1 superfamily)